MRLIAVTVILIAICLPVMAEKADLKLLPKEIDVVLSVNIKPAEESEGFESYVDPALAELEAFQKATGIELKDDAVSITIASKEHVLEEAEEEGGKDKTETRAYTVIKGKFDSKAIMETLNNPPPAAEGEPAPPKVTTETFLRTDIHSLNKNKLTFAFTDKYTLLVGKIECVKEMIQIKSRKAKPASTNTQILVLIPPVIKTTIMWGVYIKPEEEETDEEGDNRGRPRRDDGDDNENLNIMQVFGGEDTGILMQGRGGWGGGRGGRGGRGNWGGMRGLGGNNGEDDMRGLMGLANQLTGFEALGMEAKTIKQLKQGGKLTEYVIFNIWLQFEDANEANSLSQTIKQAQNLMRQANTNTTDPRANWMARIPQADMLNKMEVKTAGKIVKIQFKYEKEEWAEAQGQFNNMYMNGFQQGLSEGGGAADAGDERIEDVGEGFEF